MSSNPEYQFHTLRNGIRLVHKRVKAPVAHLGVMVRAGSRDEKMNAYGLAHFIEHLIFKGTKRRKAYHVLSRLENVGGDLNAFTTKEETCIYASFLPQYYARAAELFSDILLNSTFPEKEMLKEKDVIRDEIQSYFDSPAEQIFDDIEDQVFADHPLGHPILGDFESLERLNKDDILEFVRKHYGGPCIVLASVGDLPLSSVIRVLEKYFEPIPNGSRSVQTPVPVQYTPQHKREQRNTYQAHCMMANVAPAAEDPLRLPMVLLNNILGGPGMNTRLNLGIREKYGFCYHIESHYTPFTDTGIFTVYFGVEHRSVNKTFELVRKELHRLRNNSLGTVQLHLAKKQLVGQLAIGFESNLSEMLSMGKSLQIYGRIDPFDEIQRKIESINTSGLLEAANWVFNPELQSTLVYSNEK